MIQLKMGNAIRGIKMHNVFWLTYDPPTEKLFKDNFLDDVANLNNLLLLQHNLLQIAKSSCSM